MNSRDYFSRELYSERVFPTKYDVFEYKSINQKTRVQIFQQANSILSSYRFYSRDMDRKSFFYGIMTNLKHRKGKTDYTDLLTNTSIRHMKSRREKDIGVFSNDKDEQEFFRLLVYVYDKNYMLILDLIDLLSNAILEHCEKEASEQFDEAINEVFKRNGIGYGLINGQLIHKGSEITHLEITRPALLYLADPRYSIANEEVLNAFSKFRNNQFKDAIVAANRAFESTMKTIIENNQWSIVTSNSNRKPQKVQEATASTLINTILKNADVEEKFNKIALEGISKTLQSLPSLRNSHGGHGDVNEITEIEQRHCELALHMTASNILYLIKTYG